MFSLTYFVVFALTALWVPHRCPNAQQHCYSTGNAYKNPAKSYYSELCSSDTEMEVQKDPATQVSLDLYGLDSDPICFLGH